MVRSSSFTLLVPRASIFPTSPRMVIIIRRARFARVHGIRPRVLIVAPSTATAAIPVHSPLPPLVIVVARAHIVPPVPVALLPVHPVPVVAVPAAASLVPSVAVVPPALTLAAPEVVVVRSTVGVALAVWVLVLLATAAIVVVSSGIVVASSSAGSHGIVARAATSLRVVIARLRVVEAVLTAFVVGTASTAAVARALIVVLITVLWNHGILIRMSVVAATVDVWTAATVHATLVYLPWNYCGRLIQTVLFWLGRLDVHFSAADVRMLDILDQVLSYGFVLEGHEAKTARLSRIYVL